MKKPEISTHVSDPDLVGSDGQTSWVHGRNCVYRDGSVAEYRVSIKTVSGWKSYGHFHDLETAAYVANIAILAEGCEERYELNKIGTKDQQELARWRKSANNLGLEHLAREKYKRVQDALEAMRAEERSLQEELAEKAERSRAEIVARQEQRNAREDELIAEAPTAILLDLLARDISGEQHRKIRTELEKRKRHGHAT